MKHNEACILLKKTVIQVFSHTAQCCFIIVKFPLCMVRLGSTP